MRIFGFCLEKNFFQLRSCNLIDEDVAKQLCHIRHSNGDADRNKFNERSTLIELTQTTNFALAVTALVIYDAICMRCHEPSSITHTHTVAADLFIQLTFSVKPNTVNSLWL